jgi:predicted lysophospholipase L1 biosynthesis ABC-type transport system permease subunit
VDTAIRRKKVLADVWDARLGAAASLLVTALGCIWLRVTPGFEVWPLALLISLVVVAQAVVPLAQARAAEAPVLRALGATDDTAALFAAVEGGALGGLAGLVAVAFALSLVESLVWLAASVAVGALSGLLVTRHGVRVLGR